MRRPFQKRTALVLLAVEASACASWAPTTVSPRQIIEEDRPSAVRITSADGSRVEMEAPVLIADTIRTGRCERPSWARGEDDCGAAAAGVPLEAVSALEVRKSNTVATIFVGLTVGAAIVFAGMYAVFLATW